MPDPVIVPPPPTINQPSRPGDTSAGIDEVQKIFDRVLPPEKKRPSAQAEVETPPEAPPPAETPPETPPEKPVVKPEEADVPSFLEKALRGEEPATPVVTTEPEEWPEELPTFKSSDEAKTRYKKWREAHKALRSELETARKQTSTDPAVQQKLEILENQNKQMSEALSRYGVEQSLEFQQSIITPLTASWNEAARIIKDNGADPQQLAKAMTLSGRAQFEALDEIMEDIPESARLQVNDALRTYRRYEDARRAALANAPQTFEAIRRRETERQMTEISKQREDMKSVFETAVRKLRDDAKLEVLLKTDLPEGSWWNEQGDKILNEARNLYLENTDMGRVALACVLAPAADAYRKLWVNSQKKIGQLQKIIDERINSEPDLSESGGSNRIPASEQQLKEDLGKPFHEVFLREFHKSRSMNR